MTAMAKSGEIEPSIRTRIFRENSICGSEAGATASPVGATKTRVNPFAAA
jgi:hypothetical protein